LGSANTDEHHEQKQSDYGASRPGEKGRHVAILGEGSFVWGGRAGAVRWEI